MNWMEMKMFHQECSPLVRMNGWQNWVEVEGKRRGKHRKCRISIVILNLSLFMSSPLIQPLELSLHVSTATTIVEEWNEKERNESECRQWTAEMLQLFNTILRPLLSFFFHHRALHFSFTFFFSLHSLSARLSHTISIFHDNRVTENKLCTFISERKSTNSEGQADNRSNSIRGLGRTTIFPVENSAMLQYGSVNDNVVAQLEACLSSSVVRTTERWVYGEIQSKLRWARVRNCNRFRFKRKSETDFHSLILCCFLHKTFGTTTSRGRKVINN